MLPALMYLPALGFDFVFDDLSLIGEQGPVYFGTDWLPYRPVRYLSHLFDHALGGGRPWAYHFNNLVLHALACAMVAGLARRLHYSRTAALAATFIFGFHPLGIEAVAYVSGRRDLLATVLGLGAVSAWLAPRPRPYLAVLALLAATGAKESGAVFGAVLALASVLGLATTSPRTAVAACLAAASLGFCLIAAYGGFEPLARLAQSVGWDPALRLTGHYASGLALLRPLNVVYPGLETGAALERQEVVSLGVVALVCAAGAIRLARFDDVGGSTRLHAGFVCGWAMLGLTSVVFGAGLHEPGADRHAYPLLVPSALLGAAVLLGLEKRRPRAAAVLIAVASLGFATVTLTRLQAWQSPLELWTAAVRVAPDSPRAHHNLAGLHLAEGRHIKARRHLLRALAVDGDYAPAHLGLAYLSCARGRVAKGRAQLEEARRLGARAAEIEDVAQSCVRPR